MKLHDILKETYNDFKINDVNIFDLSFESFFSVIFKEQYQNILNDSFTLKYIYENLQELILSKDIYKIKLLSNPFFLKLLKNKDILELITSFENDEDKINILLNDNVSSRIFTNHFLVFDTLNIKFTNDESYLKLLNKVSPKAKIIILKGIKNEDFVVSLLKKVEVNKEIDLMIILRRFTKDENKLSFLSRFKNPKYISEIIISLKDRNYIKEHLSLLTDNYKLAFIKTLPDEEKIYFIEKGYFDYELIASLENLDLLFRYFLRLNDFAKQKEVLKNIKSDEVKYGLFKVMNLSYNNYIDIIMLLIRTINDRQIKLELIALLKDKGINDAIKTNEEYIDFSNIDVNMPYKVDKNISIGLELECSHELNKSYIALGTLLGSWNVKEEGTVADGVEITSPILHYDENSLKQLKFICDFLNKNGFKTTEDCGGHIHLGFDYIKNITHLQLVYYIYIHTEEILALMFNKEGTVLRDGAKVNARFLKEDMLNMFGKYIQINTNSIDIFLHLMKEVQKDRYTSLNILNALNPDKRTIELRLPNGTIDFKELNLNIILYTRILEKAKYFSENVSDKIALKKLLSLSSDMDILDKKNILLDILFDDDYELKNIFYDRFEANYNLIRSRQ